MVSGSPERIINSTRRLRARPCGVSLEAIGWLASRPMASRRSGAMPLSTSRRTTLVARTADQADRRVFRVAMHAPGICAEAEHEGEGRLYADGDTKGVTFETRAVAQSDQVHVYGGFQAKNRQFIDAVKNGTQPESCFADAIKTMAVAETILAQHLLSANKSMQANREIDFDG